MIVITLNGEHQELEQGQTIAGLLQQLELNPQIVTVQVNGQMKTQEQFTSTALQDQDQVEVLLFMGGGN